MGFRENSEKLRLFRVLGQLCKLGNYSMFVSSLICFYWKKLSHSSLKTCCYLSGEASMLKIALAQLLSGNEKRRALKILK